jgi:hypothetical protein
MSDGERKVLELYEGARPREEDLFEISHVNHVAWSLAVILFGLVIWLCIALVNAENQRYALMTNKCQDPVFKSGVDKACLYTVRSRDHWWQHLWYGFTHVRPESK